MRKLASIQKIESVTAIPDADNIEVVKVNGWNVVTKKGEFQPGDCCVYFEIDSFLPIRPEFEFLRKTSYKKMGDEEGFRLRTCKMRGVVSQGLVIPLCVAFPYAYDPAVTIGDDVTELLGIQKYEPPIPAELAGKIKGQFPSFLSRTDEERVQNLDYEKLKQHQYIVTEKLDGSSASFYFRDGEFGVCSRNLDLTETEGNTFWKVARELKLEERLRAFGENLALQGELIGPGIQGNKYKLKEHTVRFFNVVNIDLNKRYDFWEMKTFLRALTNEVDGPELETVPCTHDSYRLANTREELLELAEGMSVLADTQREGLVFRATDDPKISFKAISNKFLLKHGE